MLSRLYKSWDIVNSVVHGCDVLAVLTTGFGKTLSFVHLPFIYNDSATSIQLFLTSVETLPAYLPRPAWLTRSRNQTIQVNHLFCFLHLGGHRSRPKCYDILINLHLSKDHWETTAHPKHNTGVVLIKLEVHVAIAIATYVQHKCKHLSNTFAYYM